MLMSGGVVKPDGKPYTNTEDNWKWLSEGAAKAARFLDYVPFDQIFDARNAEPVTRIWTPPAPTPYMSGGIDVVIPDASEVEPRIEIEDFAGSQPYKLVIVGEKTSLRELLVPIADRFRADLYLPTGEISDAQVYTMAKIAAADGRRMIVFYISDCDPSGWQMAISVSRKLQAFKAGTFPDIGFQLRPVALAPDQVREHGLPSTPLSEKDRRSDKWRIKMGVEQTEIDALAALNPDLLRRIVREAIRPFFDAKLDARVKQAREEWLAEAQARLDAAMDPALREQLVAGWTESLASVREQIDAIDDAVRTEVPDIELPEIVIPEPEVTAGINGLPLIDSDWDWESQTRALIAHKAYE